MLFTLYLLLALGVESSESVCSVMQYGAKGDNNTDDTDAIQYAVSNCTRLKQAVLFPAGFSFLSKPLMIPSYATLEIQGTIVASPNIPLWPNSSTLKCHTTPYESKTPIYVPQKADFIMLEQNSTNITITGGGVIDGQGWRWWPLRKLPGDYWHNCRPRLLGASESFFLTVHNITLRNSPMFVISAHGIHHARFTNVNIDSGNGYDYSPNTDGFNIQGSDIYIGQSTVRNGDDCVPIGPPSSNILVEDVHCMYGNGMVPIIFNTDNGTIRDVVFRRVQFTDTNLAITVKSLPSFTGLIENILWEDMTLSGVAMGGIVFNEYDQNEEIPFLMRVRNLTVRNVTGTAKTEVGKILCGTGPNRCDEITLEDIDISAPKGWSCQNAYGTFSNVTPSAANCLQKL
eukprot:m.115566 g.115566  ORF g.115566 m.115566 type:complete len:400 (+) comp14210_c0_seq1:133-1332(+)